MSQRLASKLPIPLVDASDSLAEARRSVDAAREALKRGDADSAAKALAKSRFWLRCVARDHADLRRASRS